MSDPKGPVYEGNIEEFVVTEGGYTYRIMYLPDKNNSEMQREGKSPYYYWMPKDVRIARNASTGDYKFHLLHFVGVQSEGTHVGVEGTREVAGGVLSLTTTAEPPGGVLEKSHEQLRQKFRGSDNRYWGWRSPAAPKFGVMPVADSRMSISNLSPMSDGTVPMPDTTASSGASATGPGTTTPAITGGGAAPGTSAPGGAVPKSRGVLDPRMMDMPRTVNERDMDRDASSLDAWYVKMEGQGPGSIDPAGDHAFTALMGSYPTAILWQGFRGAYSPVSVTQSMKLKVWSESIHLKIRGNWDRVFQHFSANASGRYWWFSADVKAEFNKLVINGGITVELTIDGTTPNADEMREKINKRIDMILKKFTEEAEKRIFEPAPPEVEPAEASTGGWLSGLFGGGAGMALKYRRDETHLNLKYDETVNERFILNHTISSTLEGFYNELKGDPQSERKYFTTLYLDDWDRKVSRIIKPVVNWPDLAKQWVGEPVAFLSCQIGYPNANGQLQWAGQVFQANEEQTWRPGIAMKAFSDVVNPPAGWEPAKTFVKRKVHFLEPPGESDNPYMRVFVEKNEVDLDPGEYGTLTDNITLEIRADSVGKLEVGPIITNVELENSKQFIEVSFRALGKTHDGQERNATRFMFSYEDQNTMRYWEIFTGQPDFRTQYQYQVRVVVKGSIFTKGMEWTGPWVDVNGNGPIMVSVPTPDEAVSTRSLTAREATSIERPAAVATTPPAAVTTATAGRPRLSEVIGTPPFDSAGARTASAPPTGSSGTGGTTSGEGVAEEKLPLVSGWRSYSPKASE